MGVELVFDNGTEFVRFQDVEKKAGVSVFFADPYTASQRGTNENANGLLRQYFPKGCDFLNVSNRDLATAVTRLNNRPRKCLGFRTPNEVRKINGGAL